jgi:hypothetical protein
LTSLLYGKAGLREFLSRLLKWRVGAGWYAVALLTAPLLMTATLFALSLTSPECLPAIVTTDDKASSLLLGIAVGLGPVPLQWTPCNFGGERSWFICPGAGCGRRVAVLYGPNRYFLCRHCYDLAYQSQRDNKMYRALHRAQDIRRRLGGSANMMEPFPEKPKGMHWSTYDRLWWEHHEAEMEQLVGMREWLDKMERRVG